MDSLFKLSKEQWMKIVKDSLKETQKDFVYEHGNDKETTKKFFDMNNDLLLGILKTANKDNDYQLKLVENMYKNIKKQNLLFTLSYIYTILKFIILTVAFGMALFILSKLTDKFHKYIQDYIFSVIMIIYSALLYKLIGDEFKVLFYSNYCFNYTKRKFSIKRKIVKSNINLKKMIENGVYDFDENIKNQVIQTVNYNDKNIEKWEKL